MRAPDATTFKVSTATRGETDYGICSTDFLEQAFRTDSYEIEVTFNAGRHAGAMSRSPC